MWDWQTVLVSAVTSSLIIGFIILIYTFLSGKNIGKQQTRVKKILDGVKVGDKVMFSSGLIGTVESRKDNIAKIRIDKNTVVEASVYGISNILTD